MINPAITSKKRMPAVHGGGVRGDNSAPRSTLFEGRFGRIFRSLPAGEWHKDTVRSLLLGEQDSEEKHEAKFHSYENHPVQYMDQGYLRAWERTKYQHEKCDQERIHWAPVRINQIVWATVDCFGRHVEITQSVRIHKMSAVPSYDSGPKCAYPEPKLNGS